MSETILNEVENNIQLNKHSTKSTSSRVCSNEDKISSNLENFWNIDGFRVVLDRCDNGRKLTKDLKLMIEKRAQIEKDYSDSLKEWSNEWHDYLKTNEEYGKSMKAGWQSLIEHGKKTANLHLDVCKKLLNDSSPTHQLNQFKKENYKRRSFKMLRFEKTHEFKISFLDSQHHWAELQQQLKKHHKESQQEIDSKEKKKDIQKLDSILHEINEYKPIYVQNMKKVFNESQAFEQERMKLFKQVFKSYNDILRINGDERFEILYQFLSRKIDEIDHKSDLDSWATSHGAEMAFITPKPKNFD